MGLPIVVLGKRIVSYSLLLITLVAGLAGAVIIELPTIIIYLLSLSRSPQHLNWKIGALGLPGAAFLISSSTTALYYVFLKKLKSAPTVG